MTGLDLSDPEDRVLPRVLARRAESVGDRPFVLSDEGEVDYGEAFERVRRHAGGLAALGVSPGDAVALLMRTGADVVWTTFAVNTLGAVWIPTNVDYKGDWLRQSLEDSRARVLVADGDLLDRVAEAGGDLPFEHVVSVGEPSAEIPGAVHHGIETIAAGEPRDPSPDTRWSDTAAVLWTSGTTGRAKGVMQSHNAWLRGAESGGDTSGTTADDVLYCCLPMYNSAAWVAVVYRALVCGIPFGLDPHFSAGEFWDRIRHYRATQFFTLGAMHIFLWQQPERPDDADNPVRLASCIPMPEPLIQPFKARFGIDSIYQGYGQSRDHGPRLPDRRRLGGVAAQRRRHAAAGTRRAPPRRRGPRGPDRRGGRVLRPTRRAQRADERLLQRPRGHRRGFRNLWYHTGDLGRRDENGQFFFFDRKADYIRHKGRSVSSFAVEAAVSGASRRARGGGVRDHIRSTWSPRRRSR